MKDSWCRPYKTAAGLPVHGGAAREARIADRGGMDRILDRQELRGFKSGYQAGREDLADRVESLEARLARVERNRST